jgi:AraC-like DNA-binding protein
MVGNDFPLRVHSIVPREAPPPRATGNVVIIDRRIAWLPSSSATISRLRGIAPRGSRVVAFDDELALVGQLAVGDIAVTVVEAGGVHQELALRVLHRVRDAFPEHPLVAWCNFRTIQPQEVLAIARAGVQDIVRQDLDELRFVFARIMASATQQAVGVQIARRLHDLVPVRLRGVLLYALEHADERIDRDAFAAVFGVSRRTLHSRLANANLPATREFLTWLRVLVACALLEQPGHTLESVAGQLNFTDGHVLRSTLRRYTGAGLNRLRDAGVLESALAAFRRTVAAAAQSSVGGGPSLPAPSSAD